MTTPLVVGIVRPKVRSVRSPSPNNRVPAPSTIGCTCSVNRSTRWAACRARTSSPLPITIRSGPPAAFSSRTRSTPSPASSVEAGWCSTVRTSRETTYLGVVRSTWTKGLGSGLLVQWSSTSRYVRWPNSSAPGVRMPSAAYAIDTSSR